MLPILSTVFWQSEFCFFLAKIDFKLYNEKKRFPPTARKRIAGVVWLWSAFFHLQKMEVTNYV